MVEQFDVIEPQTFLRDYSGAEIAELSRLKVRGTQNQMWFEVYKIKCGSKPIGAIFFSRVVYVLRIVHL
jgi:hypothetical protein